MDVQFGFQIGDDGRTARAARDEHLRQMIEQLLFTNPGERVNRPEFGSGLLPLVFMPNSTELSAALQANVQASLQQWLGDVVEVRTLEVTNTDSRLEITLRYVATQTDEEHTEQFHRDFA
jgi:phage baseplate assembly protein W